MTLDTIFVALGSNDGDRIDPLTDTVTKLADPASTNVVLAHAFAEDTFETVASRLDFDEVTDATPHEVANRLTSIRELKQRLQASEIRHRVIAEIGDPGERILRLVSKEDADLVVVGGRKRSPTGKVVFGSTAQRVILESPVPVTFVRNTDSRLDTETISGESGR